MTPDSIPLRPTLALECRNCGAGAPVDEHFCPQCNRTVDRAELTRAYEFAKDQYVRVGDDELKGLEGEASKTIDIAEFVPLDRVDPIFFEKTYYLGPDKGGERAYRLLAESLERAQRLAVGRFQTRGKDNLVPAVITAVEARATVGEIADALRSVFGEHREIDV